MTPQDVAALTALVALFDKIGTWPMVTIMVLVVVGPWIAVFVLNRQQEKRHAEVVQMYTDNVSLVKKYEESQDRSNHREDTLIDLLRLNTEAQSTLITWLKQRTRCSDMRGGHDC